MALFAVADRDAFPCRSAAVHRFNRAAANPHTVPEPRVRRKYFLAEKTPYDDSATQSLSRTSQERAQ